MAFLLCKKTQQVSWGAGLTSRGSTVNGTLVNGSSNLGAVGSFEFSLNVKQKNIICVMAKHALLCRAETHISHACPSPFLSNSFFCTRLQIYTGPFHSSVASQGFHFNSHACLFPVLWPLWIEDFLTPSQSSHWIAYMSQQFNPEFDPNFTPPDSTI